MTKYTIPIDDYRFAFDALRLSEVSQLPGHEDLSWELIEQILVEAGRFASEVLLPLNRQGDEIGAKYEAGRVIAPPGFKEAYDQFVDGGWLSLTGPEEYGGQGLPHFMEYCLTEILGACNMAFIQYTGLTHGAAMAIEAHASDELKNLYLPKMISGIWSGTMCLTESHAGTDLGLLRTRAQPDNEGSYRVTGTKIFISAGEHELSENIVHLVLARLPDAPDGVGGISLFLVPKFIPSDNGLPGERNGVHCGSIEHKMGMKAAVACVMNFDGARGWLIGQPHQGLKAMFTMMNTERLLLSATGQGAAETAYQTAADYARERLQGRSLTGPKRPDLAADPIIVHPDVRRMLLTMRCSAEGGRALALWVLKHVDIAERHPDADRRAEANAFVALMTPVVKVWLSDAGIEAANLGMQVFGGHGYIREWGMEQILRDIRIVALYEGANGIQALDLVARKLPMENGRMIRHLYGPIEELIATHRDDPSLEDVIVPLEWMLDTLKRATDQLQTASVADRDALGAGSMDYLRIVALTALAQVWVSMAIEAERGTAASDGMRKGKRAMARFFFTRVAPQAQFYLAALEAGPGPLMELADASI